MPLNYFHLALLLFRSEFRLLQVNFASLFQPLVFFLLVASLFPLGLPPESALLHVLAPGVIWVAILLANLTSLERLFSVDYQEGCVEQWCLSPYPLSFIVFIKVLAHWFVMTLPLLCVCPIIGFWYALTVPEVKVLMASILLGSPLLSFVGAIGQALLVQRGNTGIVLALLIIPLYIPVLIFGAGSIVQIGGNLQPGVALGMLASMSLFSIATAPFAIAGSLRLAL